MATVVVPQEPCGCKVKVFHHRINALAGVKEKNCWIEDAKPGFQIGFIPSLIPNN